MLEAGVRLLLPELFNRYDDMDLIFANTDVGFYAWIKEIVACQRAVDVGNPVSKRIKIGGIYLEPPRIFGFRPCSGRPLEAMAWFLPYSKTIEKRRNGSNAIIHDPTCRPLGNVQTETRGNLGKLFRIGCGAKSFAYRKKQVIVAEGSGRPRKACIPEIAKRGSDVGCRAEVDGTIPPMLEDKLT